MYQTVTHRDVGYCLVDPEGGFAFQPPRTVFSTRERPLGARAIQNCPAVNAFERHLVEIPSPIAIRLRLEEENGAPTLSVDPTGTFAEPERIGEMLALLPPTRWRDPKRPVVQLRLPYFFVTDAPCMMNLLPPFLSDAPRRWPGTMVAGRVPLTIWPQTLFWSLEWDRPDQPLALKQGEPIAAVLFEFNEPDARPNLVEAALTPELARYRKGMTDIHHVTPDIEAVWAEAERRRPQRLLVPLTELEGG